MILFVSFGSCIRRFVSSYMKGLHIVSFILLVIGGLNWGLIGVGVEDIVSRILGDAVAQVVFVLVGLAAIVEIVSHKKSCKACAAGGGAM